MRGKGLSVLIMGAASLVLFSMIPLITVRQSYAGPLSLWISCLISLVMTGIVAWRARTPQRAWGHLALINGAASFAVVLANAVLAASASAPYEPGSDWLRSVDLTPPIVARLREALASAYFAIAVIIAGIIFFATAYFLLHLSDDPTHHAR